MKLLLEVLDEITKDMDKDAEECDCSCEWNKQVKNYARLIRLVVRMSQVPVASVADTCPPMEVDFGKDHFKDK